MTATVSTGLLEGKVVVVGGVGPGLGRSISLQAAAAGAKVVLHPALAFALAWTLGLTGPALYAAVVMASLPTAQNLYVAAVRYDRATTVCRDTVLLTTGTSMLTMTAVAVFLS